MSIAEVLVVTVTKVEAEAVLQCFEEFTGQAAKPLTLGTRRYFDLGFINGARIIMGQSQMGSIGPGGSHSAVSEMLATIQPQAVVMVGIAFGADKKKQNIGDVLVASKVCLYEPQKVKSTVKKIGRKTVICEEIVSRGSIVDASTRLISFCQASEVGWTEAKVRIGLVLTGEKLIDDPVFKKKLLASQPEALGGEMEAAGLYAACYNAKVDWILIKSICDWADGNKSNSWKSRHQKKAANNSAMFLVRMLEHCDFPPDAGSSGQLLPEESIQRQLSNWLLIIYELHTKWRFAMDNKLPWPGEENWSLAQSEFIAYNELVGFCRKGIRSDQSFLKMLDHVRGLNSTLNWSSESKALLLQLREILDERQCDK